MGAESSEHPTLSLTFTPPRTKSGPETRQTHGLTAFVLELFLNVVHGDGTVDAMILLY